MSIRIENSSSISKWDSTPSNGNKKSQQTHPTLSQRELSLKNGRGNTFLHISVMKGHTLFIKNAVTAAKKMGRIDLLSIQNNNGDTPLHLAVKEKRFNVVKFLALNVSLESLELRNSDGYTAHDLRMHSKEEISNKSDYVRGKVLETIPENGCELSESEEDR